MARPWHPLALAGLLLTAVAAAGCTRSTTSQAAPRASHLSGTPAPGASQATPAWVAGVALKEFALSPAVMIARPAR
jgi:hypothetical protein